MRREAMRWAPDAYSAGSPTRTTQAPPSGSTAKPRTESTSASARFITCCTSASAAAPCSWSRLIRSCCRQLTTTPSRAASGVRPPPPARAAAPGGAEENPPRLGQHRDHLDDQAGQRLLVVHVGIPARRQPVDLLAEERPPGPVLRGGAAAQQTVGPADAGHGVDVGRGVLEVVEGPHGLVAVPERTGEDEPGAVLLLDDEPPALADDAAQDHLVEPGAHDVHRSPTSPDNGPPPGKGDGSRAPSTVRTAVRKP